MDIVVNNLHSKHFENNTVTDNRTEKFISDMAALVKSIAEHR